VPAQAKYSSYALPSCLGSNPISSMRIRFSGPVAAISLAAPIILEWGVRVRTRHEDIVEVKRA
jgi:hypothetical protein